MTTLRVTQTRRSGHEFTIELTLEGGGRARQTTTSSFSFLMFAQDQEDLRWYLEDYLQYPEDPAPQIAVRVERRMDEIGRELFRSVFQSDINARDLWAQLRDELARTRVEVVTTLDEAMSIPWELLRDQKTDMPLALSALSFVRAHPQAARSPRLPATKSGPIRILLVICRPARDQDVPFRSVASQLIKGLRSESSSLFQLDVLRPPTFEQLSKVLHAAQAEGCPYHVVHFDGHGVYLDGSDPTVRAHWAKRFAPDTYSSTIAGKHGFLVFEHTDMESALDMVDGSALAKLLVSAGVPVLILNACRSAHAEPPATPPKADQQSSDASQSHAQAFGSFAQEVMDAGVAGVVAMRYNVYVVTAAQFMADLYAGLGGGHSLGEAVTIGRRQLAASPLRTVSYAPCPLQDWCVPVVYEAAPIELFPQRKDSERIQITLQPDRRTTGRGMLDEPLAKVPDAGFYGRDGTLLAIDRAFDSHSVVLLHGPAGSGKTSTVAEFARWYSLTGGVKGPALYTSFRQHTSLARALDRVGDTFATDLERTGVTWLALNEPQRRDIALQILSQVSVLWIWDNVEFVAGFPSNSDSPWSNDEQRELASFLFDARKTKGKFLLTSLRDESGWVAELPVRIAIPEMPMLEMVQIVKVLARKQSKGLPDLREWRPLFRFSQGNPLALTLLVGHALSEGLSERGEVEAFVGGLRRGEAQFAHDDGGDDTRALSVSLRYGLDRAFDEAERKQLSLLVFFQGFVNAGVVSNMGLREASWSLPELANLYTDYEAAVSLLDRAAGVGLLTAFGRGSYDIHPAVPWFLRKLFDRYYAGREVVAARAFVESISILSAQFTNKAIDGDEGAREALAVEEENLLHARRLALQHGWWSRAVTVTQGLSFAFSDGRRRAEWRRLVLEIDPHFVDPTTSEKLPDREWKDWLIVMEFREKLAMEAREWMEAERLSTMRVGIARKEAQTALGSPKTELSAEQRNSIRTLAVSLDALASAQYQSGKTVCVIAFKEALDLSLLIGDSRGAANSAYGLALSYREMPRIRDLELAEQWLRFSLEHLDKSDRHGLGNRLLELGTVARERRLAAVRADKPEEEVSRYLEEAVRYFSKALEIMPQDRMRDLAALHNQLASVLGDAGQIDGALPHYRAAIRFRESVNDLYFAADTRRSAAIDLYKAGRPKEALEYAEASLRGFESLGPAAGTHTAQARGLIRLIREALSTV